MIEANGQLETNSRSANTSMPAAQANCAASPAGCGTGLEGLDLANVAFVAVTAGVRAAKGKDWTRAFKTGGPDEYQLYQQARQARQAREKERAAAAIKRKAEEADRETTAAN